MCPLAVLELDHAAQSELVWCFAGALFSAELLQWIGQLLAYSSTLEHAFDARSIVLYLLLSIVPT